MSKRNVDTLDRLCPFRRCHRPVEWRGTIAPGRGYQYAPRSAWHWRCEHRAAHGCPDPLPEPDADKARCCAAPKVRRYRSRSPRRQRCQTCGAWLTGWPLEVARLDPGLDIRGDTQSPPPSPKAGP